MKVFISWSGETSRQVAITLRDWLPSVIQTVDPYVSSEDIEKGARWETDVAKELELAAFGIICLTPDNLTAPWIHFEAGALAKTLDRALVTPLLLGLKPTDLTGPLVQFQATLLTRPDILRLMLTLNRLQSTPLDEGRLHRSFDRWWLDLESELQSISLTSAASSSPRPSVEPSVMIEELLDLARAHQRAMRDLEEKIHHGAAELPALTSTPRVFRDRQTLKFFRDTGLHPLNALRILVVGQDSNARDISRQVLEHCGAVVDHVETAIQALNRLRRQGYHAVVITDMFPDPQGAKWLLDEARGHEYVIPFIALNVTSAHDVTGFSAAFSEPVDLAVLTATIAKLASGSV